MAQDQQQHTREKDTKFVGSLKGAQTEPPSWKTESKNIFFERFRNDIFWYCAEVYAKGSQGDFFRPRCEDDNIMSGSRLVTSSGRFVNEAHYVGVVGSPWPKDLAAWWCIKKDDNIMILSKLYCVR